MPNSVPTPRTLFYSWQSDLPNSTNRGFIEDALQRVAKSITADDSLNVEAVVDRDRAGVPGSADIASTILLKVRSSAVFVADVSLITPREFVRRCLNPNVGIELGYAVAALGWERVVLVMNTVTGGPTELPFDLRGRHVVQYELREGEDKAAARSSLVAQLTADIKVILEHLAGPSSSDTQARYRASDRIVAARPDVRTSLGSRSGPAGHFLSWNLHNVGPGRANSIQLDIEGISQPIFGGLELDAAAKTKVELPTPAALLEGPDRLLPATFHYRDQFGLPYTQKLEVAAGNGRVAYKVVDAVVRPKINELNSDQVKAIADWT